MAIRVLKKGKKKRLVSIDGGAKQWISCAKLAELRKAGEKKATPKAKAKEEPKPEPAPEPAPEEIPDEAAKEEPKEEPAKKDPPKRTYTRRKTASST